MRRPLFRNEALEKLASPDQLDHLIQIATPRDWLLILAAMILVGGVLIWGFFGTLEISVVAPGYLIERNGAFEAVLYVPLTEAVNIQSGMYVYLSPAGISKATYGYLTGRINDFVRSTSDEQTMLAYIDLDESSYGFHWTRDQPPGAKLQPDTPVEGTIIITEIHPIEVLFRDATR